MPMYKITPDGQTADRLEAMAEENRFMPEVGRTAMIDVHVRHMAEDVLKGPARGKSSRNAKGS